MAVQQDRGYKQYIRIAMSKYIVASANNYGKFIELVNTYISRGYKLQGGVFVIYKDNSSNEYLQAMYKDN